MWKLSRRATGAWVAALALGGAVILPASGALACDDGYRNAGWGYQPAPGPTVVVVERDRRGGGYEHRRHHERMRRHWHKRGREHEREHHHHHRDRHWD